MTDAKPFTVDWSAADVAEVLQRVRDYPFPIAPAVEDGWDYGCDADFLTHCGIGGIDDTRFRRPGFYVGKCVADVFSRVDLAFEFLPDS